MGCGASTGQEGARPTLTTHVAADPTAAAKYAALEDAIRDDPLHCGHEHASAPTALEAAELAMLAKEWSVHSLGSEAEEPSPFVANVRRSATVAAARVLHGINDDPDQFDPSMAAEESATVGETGLDPDRHDRAIRRWADACDLSAPRSVAPMDEATPTPEDAVFRVIPIAPNNATATTSSAHRAGGGGAGDTLGISATLGVSTVSLDLWGMSVTEHPTPAAGSSCAGSGGSYLPAPQNHRDERLFARLSSFNLLCHDRFAADAAVAAAEGGHPTAA